MGKVFVLQGKGFISLNKTRLFFSENLTCKSIVKINIICYLLLESYFELGYMNIYKALLIHVIHYLCEGKDYYYSYSTDKEMGRLSNFHRIAYLGSRK